jgi:thioredoxin-like negative regulator of GroEL
MADGAGPAGERADELDGGQPDEVAQRLSELAERETAYGLLQRGRALMTRRHNAQAAVLLERAAKLEPGKGSIVEALARAAFSWVKSNNATRLSD